MGPWAFAAGFAAVVGHCYPIFHKFKGGKGVATGAGVLLFTVPLAAVIEIALWGIIVKLTKTASIASLVIMVVTIPILIWQGVSGGVAGMGGTDDRLGRVAASGEHPTHGVGKRDRR